MMLVITSAASDLLFVVATQKQIPRAQTPGARNDNS